MTEIEQKINDLKKSNVLNYYRQIKNKKMSPEEIQIQEELVKLYDKEQEEIEALASWNGCGASDYSRKVAGFENMQIPSDFYLVMKSIAESYVKDILNGEFLNLVIMGTAGVGKTFTALSVLKQFCMTEKPKIMITKEVATPGSVFGSSDYELATKTEWIGVRYFHNGLFVKSSDLTDELSAKSYGITAPEAWRRYKKAELLVIDEIGRTENKNEKQILFKILDKRFDEHKPTIVTTNYSEQELKDFLGDASASRLFGECRVMDFYKSADQIPDFRRNRK